MSGRELEEEKSPTNDHECATERTRHGHKAPTFLPHKERKRQKIEMKCKRRIRLIPTAAELLLDFSSVC